MIFQEHPADIYTTAQNFNHLSGDTEIDLSKVVIESDASNPYPCQVRFTDRDVILRGLTVIGTQSRDLTWKEMKAVFDWDAVRMETAGKKIVENLFVENMEDGFGPRGWSVDGELVPGSWELRNSLLRSIRDDAIENDTFIPGKISGCLFDGCHMGISMRRGKNDDTDYPPCHIDIEDSAIWIQPMWNDDPKAQFSSVRDNRLQMCGSFFKLDDGRNGIDTVSMRDVILRADQRHLRTIEAMGFPPGEYENVTLIWTGDGDYPANLPAGMIQDKHLDVWTDWRRDFYLKQGWRFPNREAGTNLGFAKNYF